MNKAIPGVIIAVIIIIGLIAVVSVGNPVESDKGIDSVIEVEDSKEVEVISDDSTQAGRNLSLNLEESLSFGDE